MSGQDVSGLDFMAGVLGLTIICVALGWAIDRLFVRLGIWKDL
jgi:hypothetical protein